MRPAAGTTQRRARSRGRIWRRGQALHPGLLARAVDDGADGVAARCASMNMLISGQSRRADHRRCDQAISTSTRSPARNRRAASSALLRAMRAGAGRRTEYRRDTGWPARPRRCARRAGIIAAARIDRRADPAAELCDHGAGGSWAAGTGSTCRLALHAAGSSSGASRSCIAARCRCRRRRKQLRLLLEDAAQRHHRGSRPALRPCPDRSGTGRPGAHDRALARRLSPGTTHALGPYRPSIWSWRAVTAAWQGRSGEAGNERWGRAGAAAARGHR